MNRLFLTLAAWRSLLFTLRFSGLVLLELVSCMLFKVQEVVWVSVEIKYQGSWDIF